MPDWPCFPHCITGISNNNTSDFLIALYASEKQYIRDFRFHPAKAKESTGSIPIYIALNCTPRVGKGKGLDFWVMLDSINYPDESFDPSRDFDFSYTCKMALASKAPINSLCLVLQIAQ